MLQGLRRGKCRYKPEINFFLFSKLQFVVSGCRVCFSWHICAVFCHTGQNNCQIWRRQKIPTPCQFGSKQWPPWVGMDLFLLFRIIQVGFINVLFQEHRGIIILPLFLGHMASGTLVFLCTWNGGLGVWKCLCVWRCSWIIYYINMYLYLYLSPGSQCVQETGFNDPSNSSQSHIRQYPEV